MSHEAHNGVLGQPDCLRLPATHMEKFSFAWFAILPFILLPPRLLFLYTAALPGSSRHISEFIVCLILGLKHARRLEAGPQRILIEES